VSSSDQINGDEDLVRKDEIRLLRGLMPFHAQDMARLDALAERSAHSLFGQITKILQPLFSRLLYSATVAKIRGLDQWDEPVSVRARLWEMLTGKRRRIVLITDTSGNLSLSHSLRFYNGKSGVLLRGLVTEFREHPADPIGATYSLLYGLEGTREILIELKQVEKAAERGFVPQALAIFVGKHVEDKANWTVRGEVHVIRSSAHIKFGFGLRPFIEISVVRSIYGERVVTYSFDPSREASKGFGRVWSKGTGYNSERAIVTRHNLSIQEWLENERYLAILEAVVGMYPDEPVKFRDP